MRTDETLLLLKQLVHLEVLNSLNLHLLHHFFLIIDMSNLLPYLLFLCSALTDSFIEEFDPDGYSHIKICL